MHTVQVSAASSNHAWIINEDQQIGDCTRLTFNVVDDDSSAPVLSGFSIDGDTFTNGASMSSGIDVTGLVQDAGSGIAITGVVPYVNVWNPYGVKIRTNEQFATRPSNNGDARISAEALSYNLPSNLFGVVGVYTVCVSAVDYDVDRPGDQEWVTDCYTFSIVSTQYSPNVYIMDGNDTDWNGVAPSIYESSTISSNEFIWRDRLHEMRTDVEVNSNENDLAEFRVAADSTNIYFLVRMHNINNFAHPSVAIGVDSDQHPTDTSTNQIGDQTGIYMGDGYFTNGNARMHYPDRLIIVHNIDAVGQRIELLADDSTLWYAPTSGNGNTGTAWSTSGDFMEFRIPRSDLLLDNASTARFTVASVQNAQIWANNGDSSSNYPGCDAIDTLSIYQYEVNASNYAINAWDQEISDNDVDFWFDVKLASNGFIYNSLPSTPTNRWPTNNVVMEPHRPGFTWGASTDADDEVTGYMLEVSTNADFNGDNGTVLYRINTKHTKTGYRLPADLTETQYYWRVYSRDRSGMLSTPSATYKFQFDASLTDDDDAGPVPKLIYIGTNYQVGVSAVKTNIYDGDLADTNNPVDIAVCWTDASGVFMTNHSPYDSDNVVSTIGRVNPNWDPISVGAATNEFGYDAPFTVFVGANGAGGVTTVQYNAFNITNIDLSLEYYVTVSGEDEDNDLSQYPDPNGDGDDVPIDRAVTTNYALRFVIVDDDTTVPTLDDHYYLGDASPMVVSTNGVRVPNSGSGSNRVWTVTDGALATASGANPFRITFGAHDALSGLSRGTNGSLDEIMSVTIGTDPATNWTGGWTSENRSDTNTLLLYHFNEGSGTDVADSSMYGFDTTLPSDFFADETSNSWLNTGVGTYLRGDSGSPGDYVNNVTITNVDFDKGLSFSFWYRVRDEVGSPSAGTLIRARNLPFDLYINTDIFGTGANGRLRMFAGSVQSSFANFGADHTWAHVGAVYDPLDGDASNGGEWTFYFNNTAVSNWADANNYSSLSQFNCRLMSDIFSTSGTSADYDEFLIQNMVITNFSTANGAVPVITNNVANFYAPESSTDFGTRTTGSTNVWRWTSPFDSETIATLIWAHSNKVWVTLPDLDNDRPNDRLVEYNLLAGKLDVIDDDENIPDLRYFRFDGSGTNVYDAQLTNGLSITGVVQDVGSGIYGTSDASNRPIYTLSSPGKTLFTNVAMDDKTLNNGDAYLSAGSLGEDAGSVTISYSNRVLGVWTTIVTVADYDHDGWIGDTLTTTSNFTFQVLDDDPVPPDVLDAHHRLGGDGSYMIVSTNDARVPSSGTGTNRAWEVLDGTLYHLSATQEFRMSFGLHDSSGVSRATSGNIGEVMSVTIGTDPRTNWVGYWTGENRYDSNTLALYHFNAGSGTNAVDSSYQGIDGALTRDFFTNETTGGWLFGGAGAYLSASWDATQGDYMRSVTITNVDFDDGLTVSFWYRVRDEVGSPTNATILRCRNLPLDMYLNTDIYGAGFNGRLRMFAGGGFSGLTDVGADHDWIHVASVYDPVDGDSSNGGTWTFYRNNVAVSNWSDANDYGSLTQFDMRFGSDLFSTNGSAADYDELLVQNGIVTNFAVAYGTVLAVTNNIANYYAAESSSDAETQNEGSTNVWRWVTPFGNTTIDRLVWARTNFVWITVPDMDNDRPNDRSVAWTSLVGRLTVIDDDTNRPSLTAFRFDGATSIYDADLTNGLSITGLVQDAGSGIFGTSDATNGPTYSLFSPEKQLFTNAAMNDHAISDYGAYLTAEPVGEDAASVAIAYNDRMLGVWTTEVSVFDRDYDGWAGDIRRALSNFTFDVSDDDADAPDALDPHNRLGASEYMIVSTNGALVPSSGSGISAIWTVTDGELVSLSAAAPLEISFGAHDVYSGISRDTNGALTEVMSVSVGSTLGTNFSSMWTEPNAPNSSTLVLYHFGEGSGTNITDSSGKGFDATINSDFFATETTNSWLNNGGGTYLSGTSGSPGDYVNSITVTNVNMNDGLSISFWYRVRDEGGSPNSHSLFRCRNLPLDLFVNTDTFGLGNNGRLRMTGGGIQSSFSYYGTNHIWAHVAAVYDPLDGDASNGGEMTFYFNNTVVSNWSDANDYSSIHQFSFRLMSDIFSTAGASADYDELVIYNGVLDNFANALGADITPIITNNIHNYYAASSSSDEETKTAGSTNLWRWEEPFDVNVISNLLDVGTNTVWITVPDLDNDRPNDRAVVSNQQVGLLRVIDDDDDPPMLAMSLNATATMHRLWINEVDYDNPSSSPETNEWIEIAGAAGLSLDNYELVLINQAGTEYAAYDLADAGYTFSNEAYGFGFFVIGDVNPAEGSADYTPSDWTGDEIQQGPTDSIQLRVKSDSANVHLVDYAGDNATTTEDQATTLTDNSTDTDTSLYLAGTGINFYNFSWTNTGHSATPGHANAGQYLYVTVTDGDFSTSGLTLTGLVADLNSGIDFDSPSSGTDRPQYSIYNSAGSALVSGETFDVSPATDGDAKTPEVLADSLSTAMDNIPGVYTGIITAVDVDTDRSSDRLAATSIVSFVIIDDDTNAPLAGSQGLTVWKGTNIVSDVSGATTNRIWVVSDADLTGLDPLNLIFNIYDEDSGLARHPGPAPMKMADTSGNFRHGSYSNGPNLRMAGAAGGTGYSVEFDGVSQRGYGPVTLTNALSGDMTVALWINPDEVTGQQRLFDVGGNTYRRFVLTNNNLKFTANGYSNYIVSASISTGAWTHVAVVYSNSNATFFKNGSSLGTVTGGSATLTYAVVLTNFFDGRLDDIQAYGQALSAAEITALYSSPGSTNSGLAAHYPLDDYGNTYMSVENFTTNNSTNFSSSLSSVDTTISSSTSTWSFAGITTQIVDALVFSTNRVGLTAVDSDQDRSSDAAAGNENTQYGYIHVIDDDTNAPAVSGIKLLGTGTALNDVGTIAHFDFDIGATFDTNKESSARSLSVKSIHLSSGDLEMQNTDGDSYYANETGGWDGTKYFFFRAVVQSDYQMAVTNISWEQRSTGSGPTGWIVRVVNYNGIGTTNLWGQGTNAQNSTLSETNAAGSLSSLTGTNEFRIYPLSSAGGGYGIDDWLIQGSLTPLPGSGLLSDGDMAEGTISLTGLVQDAYSGVYGTNSSVFAPNFDIFKPSGAQWITNKVFDSGPSSNGAARGTSAVLADSLTSMDTNSIEVGSVYTGYVYVTDYDHDRSLDYLMSTSSFTFTVIDDDTNSPLRGDPMRMFLEEKAPTEYGYSGSVTSPVFTVQDSQLRALSETNALEMLFYVSDFSGLVRGNSDASRQMNISIAGWLTNNVANYNAARSSISAASGNNISNSWTFTNAWSYDQVSDLFGSVGTTNEIRIDLFDSDFDRAHDQMTNMNVLFGKLGIGDDDTAAPRMRTNTATFADRPALEVYLGGDTNITAYSGQGSNIWTYATDAARDENRSNQVYITDDGSLTNTARPIHFKFWVWDNLSGLEIGGAGAETNTALSLGAVIQTNMAQYSSSLSETQKNSMRLPGLSTQYWEWAGFTRANVCDFKSADGGSNRIVLHAFDGDVDRSGDHASTNYQLGWFVVNDDDTISPTGLSMEVKSGAQMTDQDIRNGGWQLDLFLYDASGIETQNSGNTYAPNFSLISPNSQTVQTEAAFSHFSILTGSNRARRASTFGIDYTNVLTGTYQIVWSAQDRDDDCDGDRGSVTNSAIFAHSANSFLVIDDDTDNPTAPSNVVVQESNWTNVNLFHVSWEGAQDSSGIYQYRLDTNAVEPTLIDAGEALPFSATNSVSIIISNAGFEAGTVGAVIDSSNSDDSYWVYFGSSGEQKVRVRWASGGQGGSSKYAQLEMDGGIEPISGRYMLLGQDVNINNTNSDSVVLSFSAYFKGDMSHTNNAVPGATARAFLKAEFFNSDDEVIEVLSSEYTADAFWGTNVQDWTQMTISTNSGPADTAYVRFIVGISQAGTELSYTGCWDSLTANIGLRSLNGTIFTNAGEGVTTNWLFGVDDDNDRLNDRMKGANTNFLLKLDLTAPPQAFAVTNSEVDVDTSSEIKLTWAAIANAGNRPSDGATLSPWRTYRVYYREGSGQVATNDYDGYIDMWNGPTNLGLISTTAAVISNLAFGVDYNVAVAGIDMAGNIGQLSQGVIIGLDPFIVTQGVAEVEAWVTNAAHVSWTAATNTAGFVNRAYDVIWADGGDFKETLTNSWAWMSTVTNRYFIDEGGAGRAHPTNLTSSMRFYRVANVGSWASSKARRIASTEVYGLKRIRLWPGQNWIAFPGRPDTNTVSWVFGHDLPGSSTIVGATKISWYNRDANVYATNEVYLEVLGIDKRWVYSQPDQMSGQTADDALFSLRQGALVEIPSNAVAEHSILFIGRVPTNSLSAQTMPGNSRLSLVNSYQPRRLHPGQMKLLEAGFAGGWHPFIGDWMWRFDRANQEVPDLIWYDTINQRWRHTSSGFSDVATNYFMQDDGFVVYTWMTGTAAADPQAPPNIVWTNPILYTLPNSQINP
ncbi:MAG: LamG domain-containing protein [Verrucomicrobia bacterium]|nr:LamG domain-containing protein [Verrucomicrobiota bacterium]